jgi:hypothetical protein
MTSAAIKFPKEAALQPNFIVIGAQKSASTFVQQCIAEHPEAYLPPEEIPFFESPDFEQSSFDELAELFRGTTQTARGIKRPSYLGKSEVAPRIQKHLPDAKIIVVLRNPVQRALSAYYHYVRFGFIPNVDVETGMRKILDGAYEGVHKRAGEILEFGFYHKHLMEYEHFMRRGQMCILLHDDIVENKVKAIRRIYTFLGIDPEYMPKAINSSPQAVIYNRPRLRIFRLINRFLFDYNEDVTRLRVKKKNPLTRLLRKGVFFLDKQILLRLFGNQKPSLSQELKNRLQETYAGDIDKLVGLINRNLEGWGARTDGAGGFSAARVFKTASPA